MPKHRVVSVTFETSVQKKEKRFTVPKEVRDFLKLRDKQQVVLRIWRPSGEVLYDDEAQFKSGDEIYGPNIAKSIEREEQIVVRASIPDYSGLK